MPRIISIAFVLMFACGIVAPSGLHAAAQETTPALVDLPAAVLTPADGEAIGITGLGRFQNGYYRDLAQFAAIRSDFLNVPLAEVESALTEAGYLQGYTSNLGIPLEPGNPESPPSRVVFTSIYQYEDEDGASAAFAFNTNYEGVDIAMVDASVTPTTLFGDEMIMTRTTSATMEEEGPSDQIDTVFRIGDVVAATGIIDYGMTVESVLSPGPVDPALVVQVEELAARLIKRIDAAREGSGENLANRALSVVAANADPGMTSEGYRRIDGVDVPYYNGYMDDFAEIATPEVLAAYEVAQPLGSPSADPFDPYFSSRLFGFADDMAAADFLAQVPGSLPPELAVVEDGSSLLSDSSILIEYAIEVAPGVTAQGYQVWQQSGSVVAMLFLESGDHRPSLAALLELAAAQLTCLSGLCQPAPLPLGW